MSKPCFGDVPSVHAVYGEPCNNCSRWQDGSWCEMRHRQKDVAVVRGHIPELTVRRVGGCPDHLPKEGVWWHEDPPKRHQSGYGGSSTNILF